MFANIFFDRILIFYMFTRKIPTGSTVLSVLPAGSPVQRNMRGMPSVANSTGFPHAASALAFSLAGSRKISSP